MTVCFEIFVELQVGIFLKMNWVTRRLNGFHRSYFDGTN